ncbi:LysR family transcriptional regulator [Chelatococcus reniformis]|uniref:LysR family transcriptional regulator n=1 Tax=Chelatococcus reniformis TaxID=1494448 RepID=A0A916U8V8_9HYPH|nr:LysR family transcriptional regulator [Chelatococcus reniformis]GGC62331.1 LysR family transcriptional regulator [Chelatococcus reniformis]
MTADEIPRPPPRLGTHGLALDDFRLVRAVAAAKGLAGAAAELAINHSTAFRRLGQLEQTLGCKLFERHRTGYELTQAGEEMAQIAARMEEDAAAFVRKVEGKSLSPAGELRVATNDGLMTPLTPIFAAFSKRFPQIRLDVVLGNAALNLSRRDADVAIRATERPPDTLVGRRIATIAWAVYGRREDFADIAPDDPARFAGRSWVGLGEDLAAIKPARFVRAQAAADQVIYRVNAVAGLIDAVVQGIGIGPLPCVAGDSNPALLRLTEPQQDISGTLWLLTHADLRQAARVRAFMDFVGNELTRLRPLLEGAVPRPGRSPAPAAPDGLA